MSELSSDLNEALRQQVQHNCHISDARHGTEFGLCSYLMKMREFYRWELGLAFDAPLPQGEVGDWLSQREQLWASLAHTDYQPIRIDDQLLAPFAVSDINRLLDPLGLVYGAGIGRSGKACFFLAERLPSPLAEEGRVFLAGRELARDLAAPPAMSQGEQIFIRRESLRRMLWEKFESWRWHKPDNALGRAFACYPFDRDLQAALEAMTEDELELLLLHERGECQAGVALGEGWNRMISDLTGTPAEFSARAVRDFLADCLVTLPQLEREPGCASVHFYMGNLSAMQRKLFPSLEDGYAHWCSDRSPAFSALAERGRAHWLETARDMLGLHGRLGEKAAKPVHELALARTL